MRSRWPTLGTVLKMHARHHPDRLGCADKSRSFTFGQWNERACRLANALAGAGAGYGERVAMLAYNRVEWMDLYAACAKGGQIAVPVLFRLAPPEIEHVVNHCGARVLLVEAPFVEAVEGLRDRLPTVGTYVYLGDGPAPAGYVGYEEFLAKGRPDEPDRLVDAADPWTILYTSGTTGTPKGVVRSHESYVAHYLLNNVNTGVRPDDKPLLVMPLAHVNSIYYSFCYTYVGAPVVVYNERSFDPEDLLRTMAAHGVTFTSLVPTHYVMILDLPEAVRSRHDVGSIRQLLVSSAPARRELKLAMLEYFRGVELWEAYGSTETGLVTLLRPEEQFEKLGSVGREIYGIDEIRLLDDEGNEVPPGEVGELWARTPHMFTEYWKDPERTRNGFRGPWFSPGDMARRDEDGYYYLVDRKANMIITGGENVYPSEVEAVVAQHPAVRDVAVIGVPDPKWGEAVKAVVVLQPGFAASDALAREIQEFCKGRIAGYKRPKIVEFIAEHEMPRTATGKILHRVLRERARTG